MLDVQAQRIDDEPGLRDGRRVLIDHIWPWGISREHRENKTWSLATGGSADRPPRSSARWQPLTAAAAWEAGCGRVVEPPSAVSAGTPDG